MRNFSFYSLLLLPLFLFFSCGKAEEEEIIIPEVPVEETPTEEAPMESTQIKVEDIDIVLGYWQDRNHLQGFAFTDTTIFVACSKQVLEYDFKNQEVLQELICTDVPGDYCFNAHYGDIAFAEQDLWIAFHYGGWFKEYSCAKNQLLRFKNGQLDRAHPPEVYLLDYPGHIGAVEVIEDQVYIAGKYIAPDWTVEEGCHEPLLVYQYALSSLQDSANTSCNNHTAEIFIDGKGQDGIQVLAQKDNNHLLVASYPCKNKDNIDRVYEIDLAAPNFTSQVFLNKNWAYGFALSPQNKWFYGLDNRYYATIFIEEFIE